MEEPSLAALRDAPPPPLSAVRARVRRRRALRLAVTAAGTVAVAASVLLVLASSPEGGRDRGMGRAPLVALDAVAEGPSGQARPLKQGDAVRPEERVVFFVRTSEPGWAVLLEHGAQGSLPVWPAAGQWSIEPGEHTPGEAQPLSWRPDGGPGPYRYELTVCAGSSERPAPGGDCSAASLGLVWAP